MALGLAGASGTARAPAVYHIRIARQPDMGSALDSEPLAGQPLYGTASKA